MVKYFLAKRLDDLGKHRLILHPQAEPARDFSEALVACPELQTEALKRRVQSLTEPRHTELSSQSKIYVDESPTKQQNANACNLNTDQVNKRMIIGCILQIRFHRAQSRFSPCHWILGLTIHSRRLPLTPVSFKQCTFEVLPYHSFLLSRVTIDRYGYFDVAISESGMWR